MLRVLLVLLAVICVPQARASDIHVLELNKMSMFYERLPNNRDTYLPYEDWGRDRYDTDETWDFALGVKYDWDIIRFADDYRLHWDNKVHGASTTSQFREIAWQFRIGLQLGKVVELYYDHLSDHVLDHAPPEPRTYKLRNSFGAEITLFSRE